MIRQVSQEHNGKWTCAGRLIGRDEESNDEFEIAVIQSDLSVASIIGMIFGVIFVGAGVIYIGFRNIKKRQRRRAEARNVNIAPDNSNHDI